MIKRLYPQMVVYARRLPFRRARFGLHRAKVPHCFIRGFAGFDGVAGPCRFQQRSYAEKPNLCRLAQLIFCHFSGFNFAMPLFRLLHSPQ